MSKKLQQKQQRRRAEELRKNAQRKATRKTNMITVIVGVLIVGLAIAGIISQRQEKAPEADVGGEFETAGCTEVEEHEDEGNTHVDTGTTVQYAQSPPTSGNHWPPDQIADPGFHEEFVESERLVHNMEHGQLVIWYRPDADPQILDDLRDVTEQQAVETITVPFDGIEDPYNFVITGWRNAQSCEEVAQPVIDAFRAQFQGRGPENVGIDTFEG